MSSHQDWRQYNWLTAMGNQFVRTHTHTQTHRAPWWDCRGNLRRNVKYLVQFHFQLPPPPLYFLISCRAQLSTALGLWWSWIILDWSGTLFIIELELKMQSRVSLISTMWADQFVEISKYCQCECLENVKLRPAGGGELMADGNPRAESEQREAASELIITVGSRQVTASQSLMWHLQVLIDVNCKMWYYQGVAVCPALTQCVGLSSYLQFTDAGWQWGMSWSCEQVPSPTTLLPPPSLLPSFCDWDPHWPLSSPLLPPSCVSHSKHNYHRHSPTLRPHTEWSGRKTWQTESRSL